MGFSHFDDQGQAIMVDVSGKDPTLRTAIATARITLQRETLNVILSGRASKGDVFAVARMAGIIAAKKTPDLIPLAHPLALHGVAIDFAVDENFPAIEVRSTVRAFERTGVEMEAMVAAAVAALAIYDMCKGVEKGITISEVALLAKDGGKSGPYRRGAESPAADNPGEEP